jgi:hypothetical protein
LRTYVEQVARFGPDQLRDKALLALEEATQEARYRPVGSLALRFALAYLWARRPVNREPFDRFWKAIGEQEPTWRFRHADTALAEIYLVLDLERDHGVGMKLWGRMAAEEDRQRDKQEI